MRAQQRKRANGAPLVAVYQAYNDQIADWALHHGTLGGPNYSFARMSWIKPSFHWMAYRCGWASKPNQERALRIWISVEAFLDFLGDAALSHFDPAVHESESAWRAQLETAGNRVQWDPERDSELAPSLDRRAIQVGLGSAALAVFAEREIVEIEDVTEQMRKLAGMPPARRAADCADIAAAEQPLTLSEAIRARIGADVVSARR